MAVEPSITPVAPLREVRGPSALGGGSRRFLDLLWLMSVTEFKRVYFGTVLGYFWSLVRPLALFGVLLFVFTRVFKIGSNEATHYPVLLLQGIVLYTFFQEATTNSVTSVVAQEGVVRKTQFPRAVIPLATTVTAIFNLLLNLIIVLVFVLAFGVDPTWTWLLFPFVVLALFILRYTCPDLHRPFKTWIIVPFFFLIAQGFLLTAPFLRPPGGKGDTSLPYWLYPIVGITVLVVGGTWWLVWRVVWPKLGKFEWVETKASLRDGTVVTGFKKRKVA